MTTSIVVSNHAAEVSGTRMTREQLDLLKRTIARGTTDDEFALFVATAARLGLDPFSKQIHCVKRYDSREQREVMAIQVGIDGFRSSAERTGEYDGQEGPYWCGADGKWVDVWTANTPPVAAKVLVFRKGVSRPFVGIARYKSYVQTKKDGTPNSMWARGDDFMTAKCAEAVAIRKGFPQQLSGVYAPEEVAVEEVEAADTRMFGPITATAPQPAARTPPTQHVNDSRGTSADPLRGPTAPSPLTEADVVALIEAIENSPTVAALRELAKTKIDGASFDQPQRERLTQAYADQRKLIVDAERALAEHAKAGA